MASKPTDLPKNPDPRLTTFVQCYLETRDATASARRAGFASPARTAQRLLDTKEVQDLVEEQRALLGAAQLTIEFLDARLLDFIRSPKEHPFRGLKDAIDAIRMAYDVLSVRQEKQSANKKYEVPAEPQPIYVPRWKREQFGIHSPESEAIERKLLPDDYPARDEGPPTTMAAEAARTGGRTKFGS